jgi:hypothetical protein
MIRCIEIVTAKKKEGLIQIFRIDNKLAPHPNPLPEGESLVRGAS